MTDPAKDAERLNTEGAIAKLRDLLDDAREEIARLTQELDTATRRVEALEEQRTQLDKYHGAREEYLHECLVKANTNLLDGTPPAADHTEPERPFASGAQSAAWTGAPMKRCADTTVGASHSISSADHMETCNLIGGNGELFCATHKCDAPAGICEVINERESLRQGENLRGDSDNESTISVRVDPSGLEQSLATDHTGRAREEAEDLLYDLAFYEMPRRDEQAKDDIEKVVAALTAAERAGAEKMRALDEAVIEAGAQAYCAHIGKNPALARQFPAGSTIVLNDALAAAYHAMQCAARDAATDGEGR